MADDSFLNLIKRLRNETQASLTDCQKVLNSTSGDYEEAKLQLRKLGLVAAGKRSLMATNEGLVAAFANDHFGVMIELKCETDFVARSTVFHALANAILFTAYHSKVETIDDLMKFKVDLRVINSYVPTISKISGVDFAINADEMGQINGESIDHAIKIILSTVGENISLSRLETMTNKNGFVISYLHNRKSPVIGAAGILVSFDSDDFNDEIRDFANKVATHTIALRPDVVVQSDIDPTLIEKEKEVYKYQVNKEGKQGDIAEKIIAGKLSKYYEKTVLMMQPYFFDSTITVGKFIENKMHELKLNRFNVSGFKMCFLDS